MAGLAKIDGGLSGRGFGLGGVAEYMKSVILCVRCRWEAGARFRCGPPGGGIRAVVVVSCFCLV